MDKNRIVQWAEWLCPHFDQRTAMFLIGGAALVVSGHQVKTKDLDLVVRKEADRQCLITVLKSIGYRVAGDGVEEQYDKPIALRGEMGDVDVFVSRTTHFSLSATMVQRATTLVQSGNGCIYVVSDQDILLLKSATGRRSDNHRIATILNSCEINWDDLILELQQQQFIGNHRVHFDLLQAFSEAEVLALIPDSVLEFLAVDVKGHVDQLLKDLL